MIGAPGDPSENAADFADFYGRRNQALGLEKHAETHNREFFKKICGIRGVGGIFHPMNHEVGCDG
jgi:hypothetical protein